MFQYPYGDSQQLNLDWLMEQWLETKASIDGSLQGEIDRVEAAINDLLRARDEAVAAQTAAETAATSAAGYAGTASGAASTATAQATAAAASAALAGTHASNAQTSETNAGLQATAAGNLAAAAAVSETNARNSELAAAASSSAAAGNALYAEGMAKGTQNGTPVPSGSPYYENNAAYWAGEAQAYDNDAAAAAYYSEAMAKGTMDGIPVSSGDPGYEDNAKYYKDQAAAQAAAAAASAAASLEQKTIANVAIATFTDGADNVPAKSVVVDIAYDQYGSNTPSPTNVRDISGWSKCIVGNSPVCYPLQNGGLGDNDGQPNTSLYRIRTDFIPYNGEETLSVYLNIAPEYDKIGYKLTVRRIYWYDNTNTFLESQLLSTGAGNRVPVVNAPVSPPSNASSYRLVFQRTTTSLELSATGLYCFINPHISIVDFPSIIYSGTLDVTNGKLTVTKAYALLDDPDKWINATGTLTYKYNQDFSDRKKYSDSYEGLICSSFLAQLSTMIPYCRWSSVTGETFGIRDDTATISLDDIKTMASNGDIAICYDIDPVVYDVTPTQVKTLLGANNIWSSTGEIDTLTYYKLNDTSTQILLVKALLATEESSTTASQAYSVNDFLILNNTLYIVTANIANGGTITVGTNVNATTIGAQITALLNA